MLFGCPSPCSCISSVCYSLNTPFVTILVSSFLDPRVYRDKMAYESRCMSQDGAEDGSRVACSGKPLQFFVCLFVFLLFYVLDVVSITVYDRDTLLNIGSSVAQRKPDFEFLNAGGLFTDTASELFVWVAQSRKRRRRRKRGKRAGVLVRLRRRAFRHPLPTILLANVQSLDNKLCELRARISYQRETRDCCVICLTETWMSAMVPDSAIELTGFSVHRSDRAKELTGKSRGGGVCFYINNSWCNERNIHSIKSFCSPDLEFHMLLCRPFWLPREFTAIMITAVYIPPKPTQTRHSGNCTGI